MEGGDGRDMEKEWSQGALDEDIGGGFDMSGMIASRVRSFLSGRNLDIFFPSTDTGINAAM